MSDAAPHLLIFAGSLLTILALTGIAAYLQLGKGVRIENAAHARALAAATEPDFFPHAITVDADGKGALLLDDAGHVMLLRRHGARFAARMIDKSCLIRLDQNQLTITMPERFFGTTTLNLGRACPHWAANFRRLAER